MPSGVSRIVVVGGGIMGASVAWHLARSGAGVTVLEKGSEPVSGVTRWSYGWVGTSSAFPSDNPLAFASKREAIAEFSRLERDLGPLPVAARGALVWLEGQEETSKLIEEQQAARVRMEALNASQVAELEPRLAMLPALAAFAPDDFAVEPVDLTQRLLASAQDSGAAVVYGASVEAVEAVETRGGRVAGVRLAHKSLPADIVVLANAASAACLAAGLGLLLPLRTEPAVLMRFATEERLASHLLYGEGLELRPGLEGGLVCAEDYPIDGGAGLATLVERTADTIARMFNRSDKPSLISCAAIPRPMTDDGSPLRAFLPEVEGLYAVVAHPGVILAPRLGRLAADEIARSLR